jgi:hypothetical protein
MTAQVFDHRLPRSRWFPELFRSRSLTLRPPPKIREWMLRTLVLPFRVLLVPGLVALASGPVRGVVAFDRHVTEIVTRHTAGSADWLADGWVHPRIAAGIEQLLNYTPLALLLLAVAVFVTRLHNFLPMVCISWISVLEGRKFSHFDLGVALSLPLSLGVTLARYDSVSWLAWGAFTCAYLFCRWAYDGSRLDKLWNWRVRLGGHAGNGSSGMGNGD